MPKILSGRKMLKNIILATGLALYLTIGAIIYMKIKLALALAGGLFVFFGIFEWLNWRAGQ